MPGFEIKIAKDYKVKKPIVIYNFFSKKFEGNNMKMTKLSMIIIMGFAISGCASSGSDMSKAKKNNRNFTCSSTP